MCIGRRLSVAQAFSFDVTGGERHCSLVDLATHDEGARGRRCPADICYVGGEMTTDSQTAGGWIT